jgi:hypothetical protein
MAPSLPEITRFHAPGQWRICARRHRAGAPLFTRPRYQRPHIIRWARKWAETITDKSTEVPTRAYFEALGREPRLAPWQFQQAVRAVAWFARDTLCLPWANGSRGAQPFTRSTPFQPPEGRDPVRVVSVTCTSDPPPRKTRNVLPLNPQSRGAQPFTRESRGARTLYANISSASNGLVTCFRIPAASVARLIASLYTLPSK